MAYTRVRLYTPNTPLQPVKNGGAGQDLGACAPRPQPKTATDHKAPIHPTGAKMATENTAMTRPSLLYGP